MIPTELPATAAVDGRRSRVAIACVRVACSLVACSLVAGLAGCVDLAPAYRRPDAPTAATWDARGAGGTEADGMAASASRVEWSTFIVDERLREVVARSLAGNRDLRIAALDVERARALYRVQRSARLPSLVASASIVRTRLDGFTANSDTATVGVPGYEIDLFGRLQNLSDAALAAYFSTAATRRGTQVLVVSEVADAWLTLAADEERLAVTRQTLDSQQRTLELTIRIRALGATTGLAVAQVRSTVEAARVQVAQLQTTVAQDRDALDLLIGAPFDEALAPGPRVPADAATLFDVPRDLPSTVLLERPDVMAAEQNLKAAHANIGAARAAFFPRIALTGSVGRSSVALNGLFGGGSGLGWTFGPSLSVPIFDGGFNAANLAIAEVDRDVAVASYERAVQTAFREVADVLAARRTLDERIAGQQALVGALETTLRLSDAVFREGGSTYLTVLDAERSLYGAQQTMISLKLEEQTSRVALYKALGGGWNDGGSNDADAVRERGDRP